MRLMDVDLDRRRLAVSMCCIRDRKTGRRPDLDNLLLPMPGHHNALNATAAITVAYRARRLAETNPQGAGRLWRRQAALHHDGRMERRHHLRRLRPSSGRNRRGAARRARLDQGQGRRGGAAASLHAAAIPVRSVRDLLQRRRRGDRRRCLSGGRSEDRGRRP